MAKGSIERAAAGFIVSALRPSVKTAAISGWSPNPARGPNVLDTAKYMKLVRDVAGLIGFKLKGSWHDNNGKCLPEHHGRFLASHIEKKLAVFWVAATLKAVLHTSDLRRLYELRVANVPDVWREAWVYLDHSPCGSDLQCWTFLAAIKAATGINILVQTRPFLVRGIRKGPTACPKCPCDRCRRRFGQAGATVQLSHPDEEVTIRSAQDVEAEAGSPNIDAEVGRLEPRSNNGNTESDIPLEPCKPPQEWKLFYSPAQGVYGKPVDGRSRQRPEVGITYSNSRMLVESRTGLDLQRFLYDNRSLPSVEPSASEKTLFRDPQRESLKMTTSSSAASKPAPRNKSAATTNRHERLGARSVFAKAVAYHRHRNAGNI